MNNDIRQLLIDSCIKHRPVYYGDIMKQLGLTGGNNDHHNQLSQVLADISRFEHSHGRPMLSSIAIYSPATSIQKNGELHGNGFYELAEELGKGSKSVLKQQEFAVVEMANCRDYWNNDMNYAGFYNLVTVPVVEQNTAKSYHPPFFSEEEIQFLNKWGGQVYDLTNPEHVAAGKFIKDSIGSKVVFWSNELVNRLEGYETFNWRMWLSKGWTDTEQGKERIAKFKHYSWARIYKKGDENRDIFFTVEANGEEQVLVYKLHYLFEKNSHLSQTQKELCKSMIPNDAAWITIDINDLKNYSWDSLLDLTEGFIRRNEAIYDDIMRAVWKEEEDISNLRNTLVKRKNDASGYDNPPKKTFTFQGVEIDWLGQHKNHKDIGDLGEELVLEYEKAYLIKNNRLDDAKEVRKVRDGEGFDIISKNLDGSWKRIEVKTTLGAWDNSFHISVSEVAFSELNQDSYSLYRVFNLNKENRTAEFHEYKGNLKDHFFLEPTKFEAFKKENL